MKTKIIEFELRLIGEREPPIILPQIKGQEMMLELASDNTPDSFFIDRKFIKSTMIASLKERPCIEYSYDKYGVLIERQEKRKLTGREKQVNGRYLKITIDKIIELNGE